MDILGSLVVSIGFLGSAELVYHYWFGNSLLMDIVRGFRK